MAFFLALLDLQGTDSYSVRLWPSSFPSEVRGPCHQLPHLSALQDLLPAPVSFLPWRPGRPGDDSPVRNKQVPRPHPGARWVVSCGNPLCGRPLPARAPVPVTPHSRLTPGSPACFSARGLPLVAHRHVDLAAERPPPWRAAACLIPCGSALRSSRPRSRGPRPPLRWPKHMADLGTSRSLFTRRHWSLLLAPHTFRLGSAPFPCRFPPPPQCSGSFVFFSWSPRVWISHFPVFLEDIFHL